MLHFIYLRVKESYIEHGVFLLNLSRGVDPEREARQGLDSVSADPHYLKKLGCRVSGCLGS